MALERLAESLAWLFYQVQLAGWQLLTIALTAMLLLLLIARESSKARSGRGCSKSLCGEEELDKTSEHWHRGRQRITQLLQEIAASAQAGEALKDPIDESFVRSEQPRSEVCENRQTSQTGRQNTKRNKHPEESANPLDTQELSSVAVIAKQLRSRTRHRLHS